MLEVDPPEMSFDPYWPHQGLTCVPRLCYSLTLGSFPIVGERMGVGDPS